MKWQIFIILSIPLFVLPHRYAAAQLFDEENSVKYDTNYIRVYRDELTTRIYLSRKQNGYALSERVLSPGLKYRTNDNLMLGVGYTYSFLTINLALKMPFINTDDEIYGSSRYIDLTTHTMFRSFLIDAYFQWNKGYYLSNPVDVIPGWDPESPLPMRGDLRTSLVGINLQHLFNSERYSYKAAFHQNEFQRRSAGSPIAGVEAYWLLGMADSLIVPPLSGKVQYLNREPFNQADQLNIGVNGGYAYTFVWDERFYASLAFMVGLSGGYHLLHSTAASLTYSKGLTAGINSLTRISLGYNSAKYYVGLSFVGFSMSTLVGDPGDWITYNTGNIRINVVKRFRLKRSIRILRPDLWVF